MTDFCLGCLTYPLTLTFGILNLLIMIQVSVIKLKQKRRQTYPKARAVHRLRNLLRGIYLIVSGIVPVAYIIP